METTLKWKRGADGSTIAKIRVGDDECFITTYRRASGPVDVMFRGFEPRDLLIDTKDEATAQAAAETALAQFLDTARASLPNDPQARAVALEAALAEHRNALVREVELRTSNAAYLRERGRLAEADAALGTATLAQRVIDRMDAALTGSTSALDRLLAEARATIVDELKAMLVMGATIDDVIAYVGKVTP